MNAIEHVVVAAFCVMVLAVLHLFGCSWCENDFFLEAGAKMNAEFSLAYWCMSSMPLAMQKLIDSRAHKAFRNRRGPATCPHGLCGLRARDE